MGIGTGEAHRQIRTGGVVSAWTIPNETPELFPRRPRALDVLDVDAHAWVRGAQEDHATSERFLLFSGGNDSIVVLDLLWQMADAIVHINTGCGIREAHEFARETAARYPRPYIELTPPLSYRDCVLEQWGGFPGPGAHRFAFIRLKERCIEQLLRDTRRFYGERFMLMAGARREESKRRMGKGQAVHRRGGQVWVNPLWDWTNAEMRRYRQIKGLPKNPVSEHLHMSGECMCGAFADQDQNRSERAAASFFFPEWGEWVDDLEAEVRARGLRYDEWGVKREGLKQANESPDVLRLFEDDPEWMPMCQSCEGRAS